MGRHQIGSGERRPAGLGLAVAIVAGPGRPVPLGVRLSPVLHLFAAGRGSGGEARRSSSPIRARSTAPIAGSCGFPCDQRGRPAAQLSPEPLGAPAGARERRIAGRRLWPRRHQARLNVPRPDFRFGPLTRDRVTQWNPGLAYEGRWRGRGELGISVSRADYAKSIAAPLAAPVESRSRPWLYNAILGANLYAFADRLCRHRARARGKRPGPGQRGQSRPGPARHHHQPARSGPAACPDQSPAPDRRPVRSQEALFQFQSGQCLCGCRQRGKSRARFSLSGAVTDRLSVAAGAYFLRPRLTGQSLAAAEGRLPVGLPSRLVQASSDWRLPWLRGLSLDGRVRTRGACRRRSRMTCSSRPGRPFRSAAAIGSAPRAGT